MSQVEIVVTTTIGTEGARCWQCQHGDAGTPYCSLFCKRRTMSEPGAPWSRLPACIEAENKAVDFRFTPSTERKGGINDRPKSPRPDIVPPPQKPTPKEAPAELLTELESFVCRKSLQEIISRYRPAPSRTGELVNRVRSWAAEYLPDTEEHGYPALEEILRDFEKEAEL